MVPLEYIKVHYVPEYKAPVKYYTKPPAFSPFGSLLTALCVSDDSSYQTGNGGDMRPWSVAQNIVLRDVRSKIRIVMGVIPLVGQPR